MNEEVEPRFLARSGPLGLLRDSSLWMSFERGWCYVGDFSTDGIRKDIRKKFPRELGELSVFWITHKENRRRAHA